MARDAQMAGDRVNMEYYLQFADHYFRVLADNRARQEEQQQRFRRYEDNDADEDAGDDVDVGDDLRTFEPRRAPPRQQVEARAEEQPVVEGEVADAGPRASEAAPVRERAPRTRRPRRETANDSDAGASENNGFDAALLPPSIARPADEGADEEKPAEAAPRRTRRPRATAQAAE
jgi:hypothetical protein